MQASSIIKEKPLSSIKSNLQRPDILDLNYTQQFRSKHAILQNTISSTIQRLLEAYRTKNINIGSQEQKRIKYEVFDRFAFIFAQMNDFKQQIDDTIAYLNDDGVFSNQTQSLTLFNERMKNEGKTPQILQDCCKNSPKQPYNSTKIQKPTQQISSLMEKRQDIQRMISEQ